MVRVTNFMSIPCLHYYHPQNYLSLSFFSLDHLNSDATKNSLRKSHSSFVRLMHNEIQICVTFQGPSCPVQTKVLHSVLVIRSKQKGNGHIKRTQWRRRRYNESGLWRPGILQGTLCLHHGRYRVHGKGSAGEAAAVLSRHRYHLPADETQAGQRCPDPTRRTHPVPGKTCSSGMYCPKDCWYVSYWPQDYFTSTGLRK